MQAESKNYRDGFLLKKGRIWQPPAHWNPRRGLRTEIVHRDEYILGILINEMMGHAVPPTFVFLQEPFGSIHFLEGLESLNKFRISSERAL